MAKTTINYQCQHGNPCSACEARVKANRKQAKHPFLYKYGDALSWLGWIAIFVFVMACSDFHWPTWTGAAEAFISLIVTIGLMFLALVGAVVLITGWKRRRK
jgi:uncharacterized protein (DUF983 family)